MREVGDLAGADDRDRYLVALRTRIAMASLTGAKMSRMRNLLPRWLVEPFGDMLAYRESTDQCGSLAYFAGC